MQYTSHRGEGDKNSVSNNTFVHIGLEQFKCLDVNSLNFEEMLLLTSCHKMEQINECYFSRQQLNDKITKLLNNKRRTRTKITDLKCDMNKSTICQFKFNDYEQQTIMIEDTESYRRTKEN